MFTIDRVPGNFHFSTHAYLDEVRYLMNSGKLKELRHEHRLHRLHFYDETDGNQLDELLATPHVETRSLGLHYIYYLNLVQVDTLFPNGKHSEHYLVRIHSSQENLMMVPQVMFKYNLSPINQVRIIEYMPMYELLVRLFSILGGVFTVARLVDMLIHRSVLILVEKDRMGKLR
jgi:hypothetical protein